MVLSFNRAVLKRKAKDLRTRPQVRKTFPAEEVLRALARSVMKRQLHPLVTMPGDIVIDGGCRLQGVMMEDPEFELDVVQVDRELSPAEVAELQLISAMHSTSLSAFEQSAAIRDWVAQNPGLTATELAARIDLSPGTVSKLNSLWKTVPAVVRAAEEGRIGQKAWYAISQLPEAQQPAMLEQLLAGKSASDLAEEGRARRRAERKPPAIRVSSIRTLLPSGVSIVARGEGLSLEDLADALAEARKEVLKAVSEGLNAKTYSAVVAQKSRKAGA